MKINCVRYVCLQFVNVCGDRWGWNPVRLIEALASSAQEHRKNIEGWLSTELVISDSVEEAENVMKFMNETTAQWRNLSVEVRSVRSMLEEVISNWDRYGDTVASLQAWLEDAEKMLSQSENAKKVRLSCWGIMKDRFLTVQFTRRCQDICKCDSRILT